MIVADLDGRTDLLQSNFIYVPFIVDVLSRYAMMLPGHYSRVVVRKELANWSI